MKTQIIQLEPHDDTISVRDKMGWSQTGRVILVWPGRGRLLDRRLDLVLLLRHSQSLAAQIALVTKDPEVRLQAKSLGIPVYRSIRNAQKARWRRPVRTSFQDQDQGTQWQDRLANIQEILAKPVHRERAELELSQPIRIGLFALAVLAVLSIAAVLVPSARITISPVIIQQELTLTVQARDSLNSVNLSGELPILWTSTIVEGRDSLQTTGSINVPTDYATGEVVFRNLTDLAVVIPQDTIVSTKNLNKRYKTLQSARVPAGPGEEILVPIQALDPGPSSNLSIGRIKAIEGYLGVSLIVDNLSPVTGGEVSQSPAPTESDHMQLKDQLTETLTENARQEIATSLEPGDYILTRQPELVGIISESYSPAEQQPASELSLIQRLEFKAPYVSAADLDLLAKAILGANLPPGYSPIPGTREIIQLTNPEFEEGSTTPWRIQLTQDIQRQPSINRIIDLTRGRSPREAGQTIFENFALASPPQIETTPSWWPIMPLIPIRIDVITIDAVQVSNSAQGNVE